MNIYFVRHGESEFNALNLHQHSDVKLSDLGKQQAHIVANRFKDIAIDTILSSDSTRARQTADIIAAALNKQVEYTPLLTEMRRPSEIVELHVDSPEAVGIRATIKEHMADPTWHYSDEENFFDAKKRGQQFLEFLSSRREEHILAVTHGHFLKIIILLMMTGDNLAPDLFLQVRDFFVHRNTGITLCQHNEKGWRLVTWNDHAHLG